MTPGSELISRSAPRGNEKPYREAHWSQIAVPLAAIAFVLRYLRAPVQDQDAVGVTPQLRLSVRLTTNETSAKEHRGGAHGGGTGRQRPPYFG